MSTMIKEPEVSRVVLVQNERSDGAEVLPQIRRYRLARLRINQPRGVGQDKYDHLKRTYD